MNGWKEGQKAVRWRSWAHVWWMGNAMRVAAPSFYRHCFKPLSWLSVAFDGDLEAVGQSNPLKSTQFEKMGGPIAMISDLFNLASGLFAMTSCLFAMTSGLFAMTSI